MAAVAVTYTFSNSTTADATQVNQNFTDITNGLSDGTKDVSIAGLTLAGNLTANGNVTFGNASGDDLTVTASLASSIPIKTTATYDLGTSSLGMRAIFFGANSQTVKVQGSSSMSATWTWTFPVTAGTTGMTMITDGAGVMSFRYIEKTVSKTTTYTATGDETTILCDTSGAAWTLTLPAAASYSGKHLYVKKTTTDFNALTIDANASETIDGATTTTVNTQYESVKIVSDGTNWHILERSIPTITATFTPTGNWTSNTTYGGVRWREKEFLCIRAYANLSGAPTGTFLLDVPSSLVIDSAKLADASGFGGLNQVGTCWINDNDTAANRRLGTIFVPTTTTISIIAAESGQVSATVPFTFATGDYISMDIRVPISGWKG